MKKAIKIILIVLSIVIFAFVVVAGTLLYIGTRPVTKNGMEYVERYIDYYDNNYVGYTEDDFGEYENIDYQMRLKPGIFRTFGSMYIVEYSNEQYDKQLQAINDIKYLDSAVMDDDSYYLIPSEKVEENGWTIRVADIDGYNWYPKQFKMIGTNDDKNTIVYMLFSDDDIDFISDKGGEEQLKSFIEEYFDFHFE